MATCYRHKDRETGVSCSNCGNPICPDCMTATPVGMRCPECAKQKTKVRTAASIGGGVPVATQAIIVVNVVIFLFAVGLAPVPVNLGGLNGPDVADGEVWRLITSAFLHADVIPFGLLHVGFNMYILYFLGTMIEPAIGRLRFVALYFASLLGGAFGALLLSPDRITVGASGAVFGLMGAAFVMQRARGIDPMQSGIGGMIALNLLFTFGFAASLNISIGGHLGGLAAGFAAAYLIEEVARRRRSQLVGAAGCVLVAIVALAGSLAIAGRAQPVFGALLSLF